jgi:hypothetical protein
MCQLVTSGFRRSSLPALIQGGGHAEPTKPSDVSGETQCVELGGEMDEIPGATGETKEDDVHECDGLADEGDESVSQADSGVRRRVTFRRKSLPEDDRIGYSVADSALGHSMMETEADFSFCDTECDASVLETDFSHHGAEPNEAVLDEQATPAIVREENDEPVVGEASEDLGIGFSRNPDLSRSVHNLNDTRLYSEQHETGSDVGEQEIGCALKEDVKFSDQDWEDLCSFPSVGAVDNVEDGSCHSDDSDRSARSLHDEISEDLASVHDDLEKLIGKINLASSPSQSADRIPAGNKVCNNDKSDDLKISTCNENDLVVEENVLCEVSSDLNVENTCMVPDALPEICDEKESSCDHSNDFEDSKVVGEGKIDLGEIDEKCQIDSGGDSRNQTHKGETDNSFVANYDCDYPECICTCNDVKHIECAKIPQTPGAITEGGVISLTENVVDGGDMVAKVSSDGDVQQPVESTEVVSEIKSVVKDGLTGSSSEREGADKEDYVLDRTALPQRLQDIFFKIGETDEFYPGNFGVDRYKSDIDRTAESRKLITVIDKIHSSDRNISDNSDPLNHSFEKFCATAGVLNLALGSTRAKYFMEPELDAFDLEHSLTLHGRENDKLKNTSFDSAIGVGDTAIFSCNPYCDHKYCDTDQELTVIT